VDTTSASDIDKVFSIILSDVLGVVERFGGERVVIENSPYRAEEGNTMRLCVLPDMITRVIKESGCGLLLDISHAIITAKSLGMGPDDYMAQLPTGVMKEMHFAGIRQNQVNGYLMDHLSIQENDWQWLDWVIKHIRSSEWNTPWLLAFEYGGVGEPFEWRTNPEVILEQVPQLFEHIKVLRD
jgi:uncharacterized protein (UPF0276 family)